MAAADSAGDGCRGGLPAERGGRGGGGDRRGHGQDREPRAASRPTPSNELDCNGYSPKYGTVRETAGHLRGPGQGRQDGKRFRFEDNGHYIGHDEPSVKFISSTPGSGNTMTYLTKIPVDPKPSPTPSGSVTNYGELSVAPWFGLPMCDPLSFPQNACTPDSDTNTGLERRPRRLRVHGAAGVPAGLHPVRRQR